MGGGELLRWMDEWVDAVDEWVFGRVQLTNGFCVGKR